MLGGGRGRRSRADSAVGGPGSSGMLQGGRKSSSGCCLHCSHSFGEGCLCGSDPNQGSTAMCSLKGAKRTSKPEVGPLHPWPPNDELSMREGEAIGNSPGCKGS